MRSSLSHPHSDSICLKIISKSTFEQPCVPKLIRLSKHFDDPFKLKALIRPGGISLPGEAKDPFAEIGILVKDEQRWFHVSTASYAFSFCFTVHSFITGFFLSRCASGMVFAINPTWPQTYEAFRAKAMSRNESLPWKQPPPPFGNSPQPWWQAWFSLSTCYYNIISWALISSENNLIAVPTHLKWKISC